VHVVMFFMHNSSNPVGGTPFILHIKGKSKDETFDDKPLEVRQSHSSDQARKQIGLSSKAECVKRLSPTKSG
jgi:hypothetical protein